MFKVAKGRQAAKDKPDIWAEGKQYVPLDSAVLVRVSGILARRQAAVAWTAGSVRTAGLSIVVEDGWAAGAVARLGRLSSILPSRTSVSHGLARLSRLEARAAALIDHLREEIEPLEQGDLRSFMDQRRREAAIAAAEKLRKETLAQSARERAAALARRAQTEAAALAPAPAICAEAEDLQTNPTPAEPADPTKVALEELLAIRAALAAAPLPPDPPPPPPEPPTPLVRPLVFATGYDRDDAPPQLDAPPPAPAAPGLAQRMARALGRAIGRAVLWLAAQVWRLAGPPLTQGAAWVMGWGLFVLLLPYGLVKALQAHARGTDLRYFD